MNGTNLVADTNIILYLLAGDTLVADLLNDRQVYISFITELELLSFKDLTAAEKKKIEEFISECSIIDINPTIKAESIVFRKKYSLKLPDAIISATAYFLNLPLITADIALKKIKEIDILLYEKG